MSTAPKRASRAPLNRQQALQTAVALADQGGVESLSMRKLAQELGVEAMSLYHHVTNKDDILDGMVDLVYTEFALPADHTDWKRSLRGWGNSVRTVLSRHPWAISLMFSRATPGPMSLQHLNTLFGYLRGAGFSVQMAAHAVSILDSYVYGFVLQEVNLPFKPGDEFAKGVDNIAQRLPPNDFPHLIELTVEHVMKPGYSYGNEFEYGFDLILDALENRLEASLSANE